MMQFKLEKEQAKLKLSNGKAINNKNQIRKEWPKKKETVQKSLNLRACTLTTQTWLTDPWPNYQNK